MTAVCVSDDPFSYLRPPVSSGSGDMIGNLRSRAGFILGTADSFLSAVAGFSPLTEWVVKPFAGDWNGMDRAADAWRNSGGAIGAVTSNINELPGQVGDSWNGASKDEWVGLQERISRTLRPLPTACKAMGMFAEALADMARAIGEMIAEILGYLANKVTRILIQAAIPVIGWATAAADTAHLAYKVVRFAKMVRDRIIDFYKKVNQVKKYIAIIASALNALRAMASALIAAGAAAVVTSRLASAAAGAGPPGSSGGPGSRGGGGGSW